MKMRKSSGKKRSVKKKLGFITTGKTYRKGGGPPPTEDRATDNPGPKVRRKR
jgi:hypothetical protein